tara:strand:+ start:314 stop:802 length:489 start_codon:yes stop_codon:yes gene_type:complete
MHNKNNNNKSQNFIQGLRPFSASIPHGFKKILKKGGYNMSNVIDNWTKIVGSEISKSCYPNTIKVDKDLSNGKLVLSVIHGKELEVEYNKKKIIDEINSFFGYNYIKNIKLKVVQEKKVSTKNNFNLKKNMDSYNNKIKKINNQNLKDSLTKLIRAYKTKND